MLRFQGTFESSHPPQRGGRDGKCLTKNQGVLGCHQKKTVATEGGYFWWGLHGAILKNVIYIFFSYFFLIARQVQIYAIYIHLQSESLLTVWILICCPPGDTS